MECLCVGLRSNTASAKAERARKENVWTSQQTESKSPQYSDHKIKTQAPATTQRQGGMWINPWFHEENQQSDKQTYTEKTRWEANGGDKSSADHPKHPRASEWAREKQVYIPPEGKTTAKIMGTKTNKRGRKENIKLTQIRNHTSHTLPLWCHDRFTENQHSKKKKRKTIDCHFTEEFYTNWLLFTSWALVEHFLERLWFITKMCHCRYNEQERTQRSKWQL